MFRVIKESEYVDERQHCFLIQVCRGQIIKQVILNMQKRMIFTLSVLFYKVWLFDLNSIFSSVRSFYVTILPDQCSEKLF